MSLLDGSYVDPKFLAQCIEEVKKKGTYVPAVLVLSEEGFNELLNAAFLHGHATSLKVAYTKLGINRVVWAHDVPVGAFELTSDRALDKLLEDDPNLQVLSLNKESRK